MCEERKVEVFASVKEGNNYRPKHQFTGTFRAWGVDYKEDHRGIGNFSTAIVEKDDGSIHNISVNYVRFVVSREHG